MPKGYDCAAPLLHASCSSYVDVADLCDGDGGVVAVVMHVKIRVMKLTVCKEPCVDVLHGGRNFRCL